MPSSSLSKTIDALPKDVDTTHKPRFSVVGFYVITVVFNLCLGMQLLTAGVAYFENPSWWQAHVWLVRGYSGLALVLVMWAYGAALSRRIRILTVSMPILLGVQFLTIHWHPPLLPVSLAIVHPLVGFFLVSVSSTLVHRAWRIVSPRKVAEI